MITFKPYGRLGNFLYKAAAMIGYAIKNDIEFSMPSKTEDQFWNPVYLQHLVNPEWNESIPQVPLTERGHEYHHLPSPLSGNNIVMDGYFQSYKYFDFCRKELLRLFNFPYQLKNGCVAIHVRRGDFLEYPNKHYVLNKEYLLAAIQMVKEKSGNLHLHFIWYSDDIAWCKEFVKDSLFASAWHYHGFSEGKTEVEDLVSAASCEHSIISNSTFGVWIAELNQNPNKIIIIPSEAFWFQPTEKLVVKDIYRPEWIQIDL